MQIRSVPFIAMGGVYEQEGCAFTPATTGEIAAAYRRTVPLPSGGTRLDLDTQGRGGWKKGSVGSGLRTGG